MPQTLSVSVVPAPPAAAAPGVPADQHAPSGAPDFLGQLKTALKKLTKAVTQPILASESAPQIAAAQAPGAEVPAAPADLKDAQPVDHKSVPMPDILAALGLVQVPVAFAPLAMPVAKTADAAPVPFGSGASAGSGATHGSGASAASAQLLPLPKSAQPDAPQPLPAAPTAAQDAAQLQAQLELSKLPQPGVQLPTLEGLVPNPTGPPVAGQPGTAGRGKTAVGAATGNSPAPDAATAATASTAATAAAALTISTSGPAPTDLSALAPGAANVAAQGPSALHHAGAPTGNADATQMIGSAQTAQQHLQQGAFQHGSADEGRQSTAPKAARVDAAASAPSVTAASDAAIAAAAGSTVSNSITTLPPQVRPAEVVSQIAHQADLYRLPGNRGVRIQLHPEGLGGVEVTLRYGVGGALQLHINVEHAATGALVQAGWTQLRDALATQGISPDRLVMSITAPTGGSQLDFSGGGSGRQTDSGTTGFAQSQSGQQRQDDPEQTGPRGWNGAVEPTSPSDDSPRVASTTAATSRIDYRA